jgi:hypothetical protein
LRFAKQQPKGCTLNYRLQNAPALNWRPDKVGDTITSYNRPTQGFSFAEVLLEARQTFCWSGFVDNSGADKSDFYAGQETKRY